MLVSGPSSRRAGVGAFNGAGTVMLSIPSALTAPGAQAQHWKLQAFAYPLSGIQAGGGWEVTVLDPAF